MSLNSFCRSCELVCTIIRKVGQYKRRVSLFHLVSSNSGISGVFSSRSCTVNVELTPHSRLVHTGHRSVAKREHEQFYSVPMLTMQRITPDSKRCALLLVLISASALFCVLAASNPHQLYQKLVKENAAKFQN